MEKIKIKVYLPNEIRAIMIHSFEDLENTFKAWNVDTKTEKVEYLDEEQDWVRIESEDEWRVAKESAASSTKLKLRVRKNDEEKFQWNLLEEEEKYPSCSRRHRRKMRCGGRRRRYCGRRPFFIPLAEEKEEEIPRECPFRKAKQESKKQTDQQNQCMPPPFQKLFSDLIQNGCNTQDKTCQSPLDMVMNNPFTKQFVENPQQIAGFVNKLLNSGLKQNTKEENDSSFSQIFQFFNPGFQSQQKKEEENASTTTPTPEDNKNEENLGDEDCKFEDFLYENVQKEDTKLEDIVQNNTTIEEDDEPIIELVSTSDHHQQPQEQENDEKIASDSPYSNQLDLLKSMGFWDNQVNEELLTQYKGNVETVVEKLLRR